MAYHDDGVREAPQIAGVIVLDDQRASPRINHVDQSELELLLGCAAIERCRSHSEVPRTEQILLDCSTQAASTAMTA